MGSISEGKFETELNLTRRQGRIERPEGTVSCIGIKPHKVSVVEDVEELRAELESVTFLESPIFRDGEVNVRDRFSSDGAFT